MDFFTCLSLIIIFIDEYMAMEIDLGDTELQNNILKFGYGINYKYMGTISHSFDNFMWSQNLNYLRYKIYNS